MKQKLPVILVIIALTGMMFAGCGTAQEVSTQPKDNVVVENNQTGETTAVPELTEEPVITVAPTDIPEIMEEPVATSAPEPTATPELTAVPEPTATIAPTATVAPTATPEPTATIVPTATVAPTATPKPTATPWPMPTDIPIPTPGPTPSVSQIDGPEKEQISFPVYKCGEKGEEVLALVKSLREEKDLYPNGLIKTLSAEYDYSEQDILYGVYNSGWKEWCTEVAKAQIERSAFSEYHLLEYMATSFPYIEEDVVYAVENCGADWNQEAVESLDRQLYASFSSGTSYIYAVEFHKECGFTNEQIEYALNALGEIDWEEQIHKKIKVYTEKDWYGISCLDLIDRLVYSHDFDYEMSVKAVESIKDEVDWYAQAVKAAKYFAPHRSSREDLIHVLIFNGFTADQAEYAAQKIGW